MANEPNQGAQETSPQEASAETLAPRKPATEQLEELIAQATASYAVKDYRSAAELYSRATELQAEINGEMSPKNADLLYSLAGESKDAQTSKSAKTGDGKVAVPIEGPTAKMAGGISESESAKTQELVTAVVEEKQANSTDETSASKPYFVFTGDEGYDESDEEAEDAEGAEGEADGEEDDDFQNAFEVLDLARVLLQRQLEEKKALSADAAVTRQLEERLADTYDLQAEISLEGEQFANAATDLQSALKMKTTLYPFESSLVAEAHYKLSLALEFAAVTHHKDASGEIDSSKPAMVDQKMRDEAAEQMEQAIASCKKRIEVEEAKLATGTSDDKAAEGETKRVKITRRSVDDVKEMVEDMQQRLIELRQAPVTVNDPRGTGAPEGAHDLHGILGSVLGETPEAQKQRIEAAMEGAKDLTTLVKRKRKAGDVPGSGTETPDKRARTEEVEDETKQK